MRSFHLLAFTAAIAAAGTACGGDDGNGNGPDNQSPTASFTAPACVQGTACTFTDGSTDSDGTIASRAWTFENGTPLTSTQASQAVTFSASGPQTVTLAVIDNEGATANAQQEVTVTAAPAGNQAPVAGFTADCSSQSCTFTNTSTDDGMIMSYAWDFGEPTSPANSATTEDAAHSYTVTALTTFTVTLTVTDDDGVTGTTTNDVSIAPPATLTCGTETDCDLLIEVPSTVTVTLVSTDCQLAGNTFRITEPFEETLFTDGCNTPAGTQFQLQAGATIGADTEIRAQVISGGTTLELPPAIRVTGNFTDGWLLEFDDGAQSEPPEPDFNDLVISIRATPVGP